ncbi:MAG: PTS sugar transporter subunit IIA [Syntrophales bacterium]|jgi:PTS system nitrogen regulatory IIA component|nr:PTS sugar transporter subunit IIA [Syntrophales bacterium]MDY0043285.1 PTS sugar transporter subunit IIA [Syntrophales bacterium]
MNIRELIEKKFIIDELKSKTKKEVLVELSEVFMGGNLNIDNDAIVGVLLEREKLGSTGIGDGIAIPHGKLAGLNRLIVSFGRSHNGVEFDALDGKPVNIFFLLMAPENSAGQHLKALAKISKMLKDIDFRNDLMEAASPGEIFDIIARKDTIYT